MRFRQSTNTQLPEIDLIPMLTVMMGVMAFFVVVTMTLGAEEMVDLNLPPPQDAEEPTSPLATEPFIVSLAADGALRLNTEPIDPSTLPDRMALHLASNPEHVVYILPDQSLPYETVMQFLGEMRTVGGDRVSLAIEE